MKKLIALLTVTLTAAGTKAQEVSAPEVQVTATKVALPGDHVGDDVTVITMEEIKEKGLTSIADVIQYATGVSISSNGGWGKQTSVFLQGLDSRDILVLFNGIPVNDPSNPSGAANFEWIDLNNVERVEILKGSQSSLYGSEAVGGVINIITKKAEKDELSVNIEGGKFRTAREKLYGAKVFDNGFISFSFENFKTLGFSASNEKAGNFIYNPDRDPFQYDTGILNFGYSPTENLRITSTTLLKGGYTEYDQGRTNYDRFFTSFAVDYTPSESLVWQLKLGNNREVRDDTYGFYKGVTRYFELSPTWYIAESTFLKGGISYRHQIADTTAYPNVQNKKMFTRSGYVEGHTEVFGFNLTGVLRVDDHKNFGSHLTYKLSLAYPIEGFGTVFKANYGTGFKAPTLSQLYGYYSGPWGTTVGNPDLDPEKSEGWNAGVIQKLPFIGGKISFNYFKNRVWNVVRSYFDATKGVTTYRNEDKAVTEGVEVGIDVPVGKFLTFFGSYTHLRARFFDGTTGGWEDFARRPEETYTLGMRTNYGKWEATVWFLHYGSRKDTDYSSFPAKEVTLDSFTTVNAYLSYKVNDTLSIYLRGINLSDKDYELAYGYNTMGRAVFTGINYTF